MSQTAQLVDTLKIILRENRITYADVATHLNLSEANIKRMFSTRHFTLRRLEEICALANADVSHLVTRMHENAQLVNELPLETEKALVGDIKLLMMAHLLISHWSLEDILSTYKIEELEAIQLLAKLDKMGIIEWLPGNRTLNRISRHFKWIKNGPVHRFFEEHVAQEFLHCKFDPKAGESLIFVAGMLSRQSNEQIQQCMRRLAQEFDQLCKEDKKLPLEETYGTGLVLALRPWELSTFAHYRREPNTKKFPKTP